MTGNHEKAVINMRKKRRERAIKSGGVKVILLLFIIIPLLGIALGYSVSKMIIIPYLTQHQQGTAKDKPGQTQPGNSTDPGTVKPPGGSIPQSPAGEDRQSADAYERVFNVEGFDLYRIQVGAFSRQQNALKLAEELNGKGMAAAVETEGLYKVYTLYSFSKEEAERQLDRVRAHYRDAHISKAGFPSAEVGFPETSSKEAGMLRDQLKQCINMIMQLSAEDSAGNNIGNIVNEQKGRIGLFEAEIKKTDWPPGMEEYKDAAEEFYTAVLESYSEYNRQAAIPGQISMEVINCYVELLKRLGADI
jgi:hypothetical protein